MRHVDHAKAEVKANSIVRFGCMVLCVIESQVVRSKVG